MCPGELLLIYGVIEISDCDMAVWISSLGVLGKLNSKCECNKETQDFTLPWHVSGAICFDWSS